MFVLIHDLPGAIHLYFHGCGKCDVPGKKGSRLSGQETRGVWLGGTLLLLVLSCLGQPSRDPWT